MKPLNSILIIKYEGRLLPLFKHILKFPSLLHPLGLFQEKVFFLLQRFVFHLRHELGATLPEQQSQAPVVDIRHGALATKHQSNLAIFLPFFPTTENLDT